MKQSQDYLRSKMPMQSELDELEEVEHVVLEAHHSASGSSAGS
jgi:hypothetical protein